ncbi:hypothetical protein KRR26_20075 [Corallococcus sp. M34]|uniref:hypothetical protein n=1 Tax=Citreicoccus inhibens TaxID=2849499 RepID=UPI001C221113|nr:hypothetical protein [Citreicoccus inhibens]MBU8897918.1 hypothetical protein [Citreicoccus inhibens]
MNLDLLEFSRRFPQQRFGFIDVDCFGGVRKDDGHVVHGGEVLFTTPTAAMNGHQQVFQQLGLASPAWYFEPFTRGYFESGYQPPEPKSREVTGALRGRIEGANASALCHLLRMEFKSPWRVWTMMNTWMVSHMATWTSKPRVVIRDQVEGRASARRAGRKSRGTSRSALCAQKT